MAKKETKEQKLVKLPEEGQKRNRIQVQFDIEYNGTPGIKIEGESETVPDLNLTVRQLLQNHTRGANSEIEVREPIYFDQEIPTITDITDVEQYKESLEERLQQVNQFIEDDKTAAEEERLKKAAEERDKKQQEKDLQRGKQLRIDEEAKKADRNS